MLRHWVLAKSAGFFWAIIPLRTRGSLWLRPGAPARSEADHVLLQEYRDRLDADVVALQEVNGPKAAALVFPAKGWELLFDGCCRR
jgi:hypothetical protein